MKKIGIIGCGSHVVDSHIMVSDADFEVTAVFDPNERGMDEFEAKYGKPVAKYSGKLDDSFFKEDFEAVVIGSPDYFHFRQMDFATKQKKHVFVEKPLAVSELEVDMLPVLFREAQSADLLVSTCHPRRLDPPYMWLKKNLDDFSEEFGKPLFFDFDFSYHKPSAEWKTERGLLLDHANHEIDLVCYLFGTDIYSAQKIKDSPFEYCVYGSAGKDYEKDEIGFRFTGTRMLKSQVYSERARIRYEKGIVDVDFVNGLVEKLNDEREQKESFEIPTIDYKLRGKRVFENFLEAIDGADSYITPEQMHLNTKFCIDLTECGKTHNDFSISRHRFYN